ncbi:MAG: hypothetical protein SF029_18405 [bacterium]|nr:hypothetical protein [bacterium]
MAGLRRFFTELLYVLLTGYILGFFSEWMFWSGQVRPSDPGEYIFTWLVYSIAAYLFLLTVRLFHVRTFWSLFLAGAVYGWMVEGVYVQTMYDDFPYNISTTGLSWHALISVCLGWAFLRQQLRASLRSAWIACAAFGVFFGFWSIGWWIEVPQASLGAVALYNGVLGVLLMLAVALLERIGDAAFTLTWRKVIVGVIIFLAWFVFVTVPTQPLALFVLPPLLGVVLLTLNRNRTLEPAADLLPAAALPLSRLACVLLIPLLATAIYALAEAAAFPWSTLPFVWIVTLPAGFILLALSLYRIWTRQRSISRAPASIPASG